MEKKKPNISWENTDLKPNEPTTISGTGGRGESRVCCSEKPSGTGAPNRDNREGFQHALRQADGDTRPLVGVQGSAAAATKAAEAAAILNYAEKIGAMLAAEDFIRRWKHDGELSGSEHQVVVGDTGQPIEKRTNIPLFHTSWSKYFDRLELHNKFFPAAPISVKGAHNQPEWIISERRNQLGFARQLDPGMLCRLGYASAPGVYVVTEQPYVPFEREATTEEIKRYFTSIGFIKAASPESKAEWYNPEAGVFIEDAHSRNILILNVDGNMHPVVIDVALRYAEKRDARLIKRTLDANGMPSR